jgi:hypothetical protein
MKGEMAGTKSVSSVHAGPFPVPSTMSLGRKEGREEGREGRKEGRSEGRKDGREEGKEGGK